MIKAASTKRNSQHDEEEGNCTVVEALNLMLLENLSLSEANHGSISTVSSHSLNVDSPMSASCTPRTRRMFKKQ